MQPDSSPPSLLLPLADGRLQPDGSSSSRSASATCLGGSRRVARRFRRSAIAAAACRCLPRHFPTCPSISSGAPLEGLGSNPGVEDHLLGHGDHRRHRDRRHRDRRHRRTAAAPPHCWGASCAVPCFSLCEVAFWAAFAYFLDSCAHFCCVGRVQCVLRAVNSVAGVLACVCALRFSIECEFALGGMDASGVFRSGVMYCTRTGPGGQEGVYIWGILALELIHSSHTTSPAIWWALDVR